MVFLRRSFNCSTFTIKGLFTHTAPVPCLSKSPSKFNIVSMETNHLTDRLSLEPIHCKFDGGCDGDKDGDGMCKLTLIKHLNYVTFHRLINFY